MQQAKTMHTHTIPVCILSPLLFIIITADVQAQDRRRGGNGLQLHQENRLEAVASAVNHITGRSSFVPRRGGR